MMAFPVTFLFASVPLTFASASSISPFINLNAVNSFDLIRVTDAVPSPVSQVMASCKVLERPRVRMETNVAGSTGHGAENTT